MSDEKNLPVVISESETKALMLYSDQFHKSGLFPNLKNAAGAFAVIQYGKELGIPPMTAMQTMAIVKGKITMMAQMIQTLLIRGGVKITIVNSSDKGCTLQFERKDYPTITTTFDEDDARKAGLIKDDSGYRKYPEEMYYWRAITKGGRRIGADLMLGIYSKEEIADEPGIVDITPEPDKPKEPEAPRKAFVPKSKQTAPPVDTGAPNSAVSENTNLLGGVVDPDGVIDAEPVPEKKVADILKDEQAEDSKAGEVPTPMTVEAVKDALGDAVSPHQALYESLMAGLTEVERKLNKFHYRNWQKAYAKDLQLLTEEAPVLMDMVSQYMAHIESKLTKRG